MNCTAPRIQSLIDQTTAYLFETYKGYFPSDPHFPDVVAKLVAYSLLDVQVTRGTELSTKAGAVLVGGIFRNSARSFTH